MSHIVLRQIYKSYADQPVLKGLDLDIEFGALVAVFGPSGCGKSTLLHLTAGLDRADRGSLCVRGQEISHFNDRQLALYRRQEVGVVFQFFNLFSSLTVIENTLLPTLIRRDAQKPALQRAHALLERVGLSAKAAARANELSGGEMQRVALCRALIHRPPLLLADEPTGNLDSENRRHIYRLLRELASDEKITVLLVSHDPEVASVVDRVLSMQDGNMLPC